MTWTIQIPSNLKAGDYIVRHELIALHYATKELGPEFYISCLNVKVLGDGMAEPSKEDTVRFPGAYKPDNPYLDFDIYHHENKYVSSGLVYLCYFLYYKPRYLKLIFYSY
jgi:hypothetical protein